MVWPPDEVGIEFKISLDIGWRKIPHVDLDEFQVICRHSRKLYPNKETEAVLLARKIIINSIYWAGKCSICGTAWWADTNW